MMNDREFSNRKETLHGEFYENALKYPERIALIYENEKVSYKMLRLYALRAANYMWQRGVRRNDKIVVILPRGIGQVAALLGILAIGAAYVPIAMKQPLGRRKKIIENVKPALVLQDEAFLEENPWTGCIENNSKDTAYIIYTSGSSGEPKGVEMSHVAAMNTIEEILHMWNIGAEDSVLNISAFDFDLSVFDIFGLLTVGGTIVLIDEDDFRDPEVWKNLIEIYGITIWNSAPALLDMFLIMGENNHFGKLRLALVSGDWIPLYLPEKWYKVTSANSQFVALGGATEGGIWSNYYCVSKVDRLWNSIPYGQALPKQKYRITDENFVECGVDIPGELQIGGGSLAKGYINDEELTMKKFITDVKGERWYRTGDRGRRWADGTIEFLGRMDTQVKIRGHRIELGEIESVLKSISRIKEAVVVAQGDKYHKELVAFYLGEYIAESEIEDYLKIHLPEYSIPNSINRLENFPLNANGKVDRRRLAEYQKTDSVEIMSDKVLNIVLMIWEELLKNKVADLDENLFKIGADSLLAARFVAAINARCGIKHNAKATLISQKKEYVELAKSIKKIVCSISGNDYIDYEDNLLENGLDSLLLSQISGRIVSDIQEAQGMRFDEILRASLTMPTIMGIAQYISDCKNPSKNQMHSNAGNQTRNSYTVVYILGDNENEIRDVLIEKLSASNISCKRVGGQEIIERCHEDISVKKKYIIAFSEMASLCITKASELLGENIIINRIFLINPSKAKESDLYLGDISIIDGNSVAIKSWEKAVLGNVREFESNSNDIFDIIMRELENDK
ncbi:MAG: non-ribosomal peptide synthetase [Coprococcus comes]